MRPLGAVLLGFVGAYIVVLVVTLFIAMLLTGCGVGGEWEQPQIVQCTNGRVLDLHEWKPYAGFAGAPSWIQNRRTGERIEDGAVKCWPVSK